MDAGRLGMLASKLPIEWDESFASGVEEIDEQHQWLFRLVNDAYAYWQRDGTPERGQLIEIVNGLQNYVVHHFETEERLMVRYGYLKEEVSGAKSHCTQHRHFATKIADIRQALIEGGNIDKDQFLAYLSDWLVHHVKNTDQKLGAFIAARRAAVT